MRLPKHSGRSALLRCLGSSLRCCTTTRRLYLRSSTATLRGYVACERRAPVGCRCARAVSSPLRCTTRTHSWRRASWCSLSNQCPTRTASSRAFIRAWTTVAANGEACEVDVRASITATCAPGPRRGPIMMVAIAMAPLRADMIASDIWTGQLYQPHCQCPPIS